VKLRPAALAALLLTAAGLCSVRTALAAPPTGNMVASTKPPTAQWVQHEVLPGERLAEIADRYAVSTASILRWNKLDASHPQYRSGQRLRIQTQLPERQREKLHYAVREGDSWARIAERFHVPQRTLQHVWNHQDGTLHVGQEVLVWTEPTPVAPAAQADDQEDDEADELESQPSLPVARSVGGPAHGRLVGGVQIPKNDALYTLRDPERAYGSSHAIGVLQRGIAAFRHDSGYRRELLIEDMSVRQGGRFGPHHSHRSGRDVDIALPLQSGPVAYIDWAATWQLIHAFVATGEIRYIFLSRARQALLYKAARQAGASAAELDTILQYPRHSRVAIVRHAHGHTQHMHVRFRCGPEETACEDI
jgi:murein endopeptidase